MILLLLHALLCSYILPVLSLSITLRGLSHPLVNVSTPVLLTSGSDDPSQFWIVVRRTFSPDFNTTLLIQTVENFTANRTVSLVFPSAGNTSIEAETTSLTLASTNITFAYSEFFQVDEGPTHNISPSYTRDAEFPPVASANVSSTVSSSTTASSSDTASSSSPHKAAIIAGVVCGAFLLASIITVLLIWRYRKRQRRAPSRAFLHDLDDKRQPRTSRKNQPLSDPPPPYSPRISRVASRLFRWARGDNDSAPSRKP
ncbi:hypothetical protein IW261DRAFT_1566306 [Armillaria novae-zelandiae]|uniref:Mid2 domain-containing protein n=1 Tax=Armillaria novae-zelandiae TaxID=153914 RepID=A0AA39U4L7_9AGAR|nr:hypothetical protein IW261DRAFT_1566306 [Armillaria novae-zelandiae]